MSPALLFNALGESHCVKQKWSCFSCQVGSTEPQLDGFFSHTHSSPCSEESRPQDQWSKGWRTNLSLPSTQQWKSPPGSITPTSEHSLRKFSQAARPNAQWYLRLEYTSQVIPQFTSLSLSPRNSSSVWGAAATGLVPLSYDLQSKSLLESPNQMKQVLKPMING